MSYMAQCLAGHSFSIPKGSMLEDKAKARVDYFDAICVRHDDCPECACDKSDSARQFASDCSMYGLRLHVHTDNLARRQSMKLACQNAMRFWQKTSGQ